MKRTSCSLVAPWCVALLLLLIWAVPGRAQLYDAQTAEFLAQKVDPPLAEATFDDHLLELSRAAGLNFIADATQFETTPAKLEAAKLQTTGALPLNLVLGDLADLHKFTWQLPFHERVFLFWKQPEPIPLAQRIVNGENIQMADIVLSDNKMEKLLAAYLKQAYGWDGSGDFSKRISIADLPLEIRSKVIAKAQASILNFGMAPMMKMALSDRYWETARLNVASNSDRQSPMTLLWVRGAGGGMGISLSIGRADVPNEAPQ